MCKMGNHSYCYSYIYRARTEKEAWCALTARSGILGEPGGIRLTQEVNVGVKPGEDIFGVFGIWDVRHLGPQDVEGFEVN